MSLVDDSLGSFVYYVMLIIGFFGNNSLAVVKFLLKILKNESSTVLLIQISGSAQIKDDHT